MAANCNCLFGVLAVILTGSNSRFMETALRKIICDHISLMPFSPFHFEMYGPAGTTNAEEYLLNENMRCDGVYGGDLEITIFCNLFLVHCVVFVAQSSRWVLYSPLPPNSASYHVLLRLNNRHWEPIKTLRYNDSHKDCKRIRLDNCAHEEPLPSGGSRDKLQSNIPRSNAHHIKKTWNFSLSKTVMLQPIEKQHAENFNIDFEHGINAVSIDWEPICNACARVSTTFYSLKFLVVSVNTLFKRKFMANFENETARLCQQCTDYETKTATWGVAWPCVIHFFWRYWSRYCHFKFCFPGGLHRA